MLIFQGKILQENFVKQGPKQPMIDPLKEGSNHVLIQPRIDPTKD